MSDATIVLRSRRRERRARAREFFRGALTTVRQPDELVVAIDWPRASPDEGHAFEEIAQRHGDFAIAAAACDVVLDGGDRIERLRLGLGGVVDRPIAIATQEMVGAMADGGTAQALARRVAADIDPMEDHVASAEYRRALAGVLIERVVLRAVADARHKAGAA
jgi:CO/xanthine dehydrogenase FAD-binding subunit